MKKFAPLLTTALVISMAASAHADTRDQAMVNACMDVSMTTAIHAVNKQLALQQKGETLVIVSTITNDPLIGRGVADRKLTTTVSVDGQYVGQYQVNMMINLDNCVLISNPGVKKIAP